MSASNPQGAVSADYVVIGAGAMGMAFADVILSETTAVPATGSCPILPDERVPILPYGRVPILPYGRVPRGRDNGERARIRNLGLVLRMKRPRGRTLPCPAQDQRQHGDGQGNSESDTG